MKFGLRTSRNGILHSQFFSPELRCWLLLVVRRFHGGFFSSSLPFVGWSFGVIFEVSSNKKTPVKNIFATFIFIQFILFLFCSADLEKLYTKLNYIFEYQLSGNDTSGPGPVSLFLFS
jgi:hypothetical protein